MTHEEAIANGFIPIKDYESYLVSPNGQVFSKKSNKIMSLVKSNHGYLQVRLSNENGTKTFKVHRLVAKAFIPNPYNLPIVNHKDESRDNNNVENLEWCTREYNLSYGTAMERKIKNTDYYAISKKRTLALEKQVLQLEYDGTMIALWENAQIASDHGYNRSLIQKCCAGNKKSHKGYLWKYVDFDYEKQIPKKPVWDDTYFFCPTCGKKIHYTDYHNVPVCRECYQILDWSEKI